VYSFRVLLFHLSCLLCFFRYLVRSFGVSFFCAFLSYSHMYLLSYWICSLACSSGRVLSRSVSVLRLSFGLSLVRHIFVSFTRFRSVIRVSPLVSPGRSALRYVFSWLWLPWLPMLRSFRLSIRIVPAIVRSSYMSVVRWVAVRHRCLHFYSSSMLRVCRPFIRSCCHYVVLSLWMSSIRSSYRGACV